MKTDFFQNIAALNAPGIWKLVIQNDANGNFTVSELFSAIACGDKAVSKIIPLTISGTAQEMDENFFDKVSEPVAKSAALFENMEAHLKSIAQAKAASQMEKDKKNKEAKPAAPKKEAEPEADAKGEKKKRYDTAMKTVGELSSDCRYEEALAVLPSIEDYPDKEAELKSKHAELVKNKERMSQLSLL